MQLNPYLVFDGNCREALEFYEKTLGGRIEALMDFGATPASHAVPPDWHTKVMHALLVVGEHTLMASDAPPGHYQKPQGFSISINVKAAAEAERIFAELAEGGSVTMPLAETFWAVRFGMVTDRFGTPWMVNCEGAKK